MIKVGFVRKERMNVTHFIFFVLEDGKVTTLKSCMLPLLNDLNSLGIPDYIITAYVSKLEKWWAPQIIINKAEFKVFDYAGQSWGDMSIELPEDQLSEVVKVFSGWGDYDWYHWECKQ